MIRINPRANRKSTVAENIFTTGSQVNTCNRKYSEIQSAAKSNMMAAGIVKSSDSFLMFYYFGF